jgi:hypothetical protein
MLNNSLTSQVITNFYGLDVRQPDLADCFRGRWNVATLIRSGGAAKVLTFLGSLNQTGGPVAVTPVRVRRQVVNRKSEMKRAFIAG